MEIDSFENVIISLYNIIVRGCMENSKIIDECYISIFSYVNTNKI